MSHEHIFVSTLDPTYERCQFCKATRVSAAEYKRRCEAVDEMRRRAGDEAILAWDRWRARQHQ